MQFFSEQELNPDDLVELTVTLKPSNKHLIIIGTVVWSIEDANARAEEKYAIAVDFSYINDADREVLVKHIHKKQISGLSQQNDLLD